MLVVTALAILASQAQIQVDPLMLVQANEVWSIIGKPGNAVWPGWNARKTPLLIYQTGKQDLLINHPTPPAGFQRYSGPIQSPIGAIYYKNGPTIMEFDGQNTSTKVAGVETLVMSDTLSNKRQIIQSLVGQLPSDPKEALEQIADNLQPDPISAMVMFAHEAFHVYQRSMAPGKGGNELVLANYPSLSVDNNVGFAIESDCLAAALAARTSDQLRTEALKWLAVRLSRQAALGKDLSDYEDGTEFNEGTAKYVEYRILQCMEGKRPGRDMWLIQGFPGYGDLQAERQRLITKMQRCMTGAMRINNDLYGASPVRFRLYFSGMVVGALLDRLGAKWHGEIFKKGVSLTSIAKGTLKAAPEELAKALASIKSSPRYAQLLAQKTKLAQEGETYIQDQLKQFEAAPGELVIDYSKLEKPQVQMSFTPFGILRVDSNRTIFRLVPIRGTVGSLSFSEDGPRPVIQDHKKKTLHFQLSSAAALTPGQIDLKELKLPGVTLTNVRGKVSLVGNKLHIEL